MSSNRIETLLEGGFHLHFRGGGPFLNGVSEATGVGRGGADNPSTTHSAKTYYQDGLAARARAEILFELAAETHEFIVNQSAKRHECLCNPS